MFLPGNIFLTWHRLDWCYEAGKSVPQMSKLPLKNDVVCNDGGADPIFKVRVTAMLSFHSLFLQADPS